MELIVKPKGGYCLWQILDTNDVGRKPVVLNVEKGCEVLTFANSENRLGARELTLGAGEHQLNNRTERLDSLKLIACNAGQTVKLIRGVSGLPYKDLTDPTERETTVGISGSCEIRIDRVKQFYEAFGCHDTVTVEEVNEKFGAKFAEILRTSVSAVLAKGTPYQSLTAKQAQLSKELEEALHTFVYGYGCTVLLRSFALGDFAFPDDYLESRRNYGDEQNELRKEKEWLRVEEEKRRSEVENLKTILEAQKKSGNDACVCPQCHNKIKGDLRFCNVCGKKLN